MQIDESDEQHEKAPLPIRESFEPASNVTLESASHLLKDSKEMVSTVDGRRADTKNSFPSQLGFNLISLTSKANPQQQTKPRGEKPETSPPATHEALPSSIAYRPSSSAIARLRCLRGGGDMRSGLAKFGFECAIEI
jgi:hypothetical protein